MSCNTFLKIATTCKEEFVCVHVSNDDFSGPMKNNEPYIYDLIRRIPDETNMLENSLKLVFFEAVGLIISAQQNIEEKTKHLGDALKRYLEEWSLLLNEWRNTRDLRLLLDENSLENIGFFLKVNERMAVSVGVYYEYVLRKFMNNLMELFRLSLVFRENLHRYHRHLFVLFGVHHSTVPNQREIHPEQQPGQKMQEHQEGRHQADLHLFGKHKGPAIHEGLHSPSPEHSRGLPNK